MAGRSEGTGAGVQQPHESMAAASPDDDEMAEIVISSLPLETRCTPFPLRQYGGFWMPEPFPLMGCAFSGEGESAGAVQDIVELCSIDVLKNMKANKSGYQVIFRNESFFRKGAAGDWSNHMTSAMAERLDKIVEDELQGTGLTFAESA